MDYHKRPYISHTFFHKIEVKNQGCGSSMDTSVYPGFQIMGSSGPLLENFGGPLLSFGGPANL